MSTGRTERDDQRPLMLPGPDVELRPGWRLHDAQLEADAIAFWTRLGILPPNVSPHQRAKEIIGGAYKDGRFLGVTTGTVERLEFLRARFVMLRVAVDPAARGDHVGTALAAFAYKHMGAWATEHREEKIAGIAAIIESQTYAKIMRVPCWPRSRLSLVGFTPGGLQVRVAWFEHFLYD